MEMNTESNHWKESYLSRDRGGRASKVREVLLMDLAGYYEGVPEEFGLNFAARAMVAWLKCVNVKVSIPTAKRIVNGLIDRGDIVKKSVGRNGFDWKLSVKH